MSRSAHHHRAPDFTTYTYETNPPLYILPLNRESYDFEQRLKTDGALQQTWSKCLFSGDYIRTVCHTLNLETTVDERFATEAVSADRQAQYMPHGLRCMHCPFPELVEFACKDITDFFREQCANMPCTVNQGLTFAFENKGWNREMKYEDIMTHVLSPEMRSRYKHMVDFCDKYMLFLARELCMDAQKVRECVDFTIIRYDPGAGLRMHIDSLDRTTGVPVCTVHMGDDEVTPVDFVPYCKIDGGNGEKIPVRVVAKRGDMLMMSGESRYNWLHGIPTGRNSYKYTILIKFPVISGVTKEIGNSALIHATMLDVHVCGDAERQA